MAVVTSDVTEIEIPESFVEWNTFSATIQGITGLLMHNPKGSMGKQQTGAKRIPPPKEEAEDGLYRTDDGLLYVSYDHVRESMMGGAAYMKVGKDTLRRIIAAGVMEREPYFILQRDGELLREYDEIDTRRVVVQRQGIQRSRGLIHCPWQVEISFLYDASSIQNPALLVQALQRAGQIAGLLDYRPSTGGPFGRYEVLRAWTG